MAALALSAIYDRLVIAATRFDIQRNDEFSGVASGALWQAELAPPLWTAEVTLHDQTLNEMKQQAALIRKLDGARQNFLLCDTTSLFPQADPVGTILGSAVVSLGVIGSNRTFAPLTGLPPGYVLTIGDKMQINGASKIAFVEVSQTVAATAGGVANVEIFPRLPAWIANGAAVILKRPACPMVIAPGSHNPGTNQGVATSGAGFKAIQKS
ncbi:hypothetical protein SmedWSM1115_15335 [Sinorhizobium medicae WSM1115]|uniref:hypothetical protein n=1 Tax=Sinorhizobium TaxID=28105 RepID=UPI0003782875|nr:MULTISPECIES: hypothetical protein [Sinorhizobium]RVG68488.1 hypothetical protein CN222_08225 [Sinorhizobium meliloti]UFX01161.1 hypothetical protein SmedWSM1115_15335 [Sinorhizobium medicae WSM1115]